MAVGFPAWWTTQVRESIPKIEDVCIQRFSTLLSGVHCTYWLPTDEQTHQILFDADEAFLRIVRLGGETDWENVRDIHRVQFAAASNDRDVAWDILAFVQRVLYAYRDTSYVVMPNGAKVALRFNGETLGPILDPQQIRDARLVPVTLELETPWPKGVERVVKENIAEL
jgi:hypothetical protein